MKVTRHSVQRAGERMGLPKKAVERQAALALVKGLRHSETNGSLNRYFTHLFFSHRTANNIRIYNEHVFIFDEETLVTVLKLPNEYKFVVRKQINRREA